MVHDLVLAVVEEEREVHAGDDEHEERVERDLAEHERPVVGEGLVEGLASGVRHAEARVDPLTEAPDHGAGSSLARDGEVRSRSRSHVTNNDAPAAT